MFSAVLFSYNYSHGALSFLEVEHIRIELQMDAYCISKNGYYRIMFGLWMGSVLTSMGDISEQGYEWMDESAYIPSAPN